MRYIVTIVFLAVVLQVAGQRSKTAATSKQAKITEKTSLSETDVEVFITQTKQKIDEFQQYIITLGDKSSPAAERDLAEKEALKLFYPGSIMETSKKLSDGTVKKYQRPMEKYLARLKALPYSKVVIEFYDVAYVDKLEKGPDGKYYGTATVFQKFTGFNGDMIAYSDITKKEISVIIDLVEDKFFNEKRWKVYLGDIKATETR